MRRNPAGNVTDSVTSVTDSVTTPCYRVSESQSLRVSETSESLKLLRKRSLRLYDFKDIYDFKDSVTPIALDPESRSHRGHGSLRGHRGLRVPEIFFFSIPIHRGLRVTESQRIQPETWTRKVNP